MREIDPLLCNYGSRVALACKGIDSSKLVV